MIWELFTNWKKTRSDLTKLQWVYAVLSTLLLIVAGLIGLVDREIAYRLLDVVWLGFSVFASNFVVSAVVSSLLKQDKQRSVPSRNK